MEPKALGDLRGNQAEQRVAKASDYDTQRGKPKIDDAAVVIADLSGANANVYLELGYAIGKGIPTIQLVRDVKELKFDVQAERCLVYDSIRTLEAKLTDDIRALKARLTVL